MTKFDWELETMKKVNDGKLAYWTKYQKEAFSKEIKNFKEVAQYYYENSKVYTEELLTLADKSDKDIKTDIKKDTEYYVERMQDAIKVIGRESDQIEALGWILTENKNVHKRNMNDMLEMIISWMETIEESVDKTDSETKAILELFTRLDVETFIGELADKVDTLTSNLKKLRFKARFLKKDETFKSIDTKQTFRDWKDAFKTFDKTMTSQLRETQKKQASTFNAGFFVLGILGLVAVGGFVVLYCRLQSAIKRNE